MQVLTAALGILPATPLAAAPTNLARRRFRVPAGAYGESNCREGNPNRPSLSSLHMSPESLTQVLSRIHPSLCRIPSSQATGTSVIGVQAASDGGAYCTATDPQSTDPINCFFQAGVLDETSPLTTDASKCKAYKVQVSEKVCPPLLPPREA